MTPKTVWTLAITSAAVFMVTLDNLVVTTAIPVIRQDLHAGLSGLQWTVNAYTLTFAVLLLTGAALGDRFGRRRLLATGVAIFTAASAGAALAPSIVALDIARALQGVGGAIVMPLTLTVLSAAVPAARRGVALGIWGAISGLAVALGPLVGGAIVSASRGNGSSGSMSRSAWRCCRSFSCASRRPVARRPSSIRPGSAWAASASSRSCGL
jgi:MFS family permease